MTDEWRTQYLSDIPIPFIAQECLFCKAKHGKFFAGRRLFRDIVFDGGIICEICEGFIITAGKGIGSDG